jgi:glycosyltransferase involved in cell wall biosynthesis
MSIKNGSLQSAPLSENAPKVSVIIPTYNSARFLPEALESVFSQNYADYEVIVVDDGSTDETMAVLQPYAGRIRYTWQQNAGSAVARNTGLDMARGEYIVFLDADDLLLPGKLREQAAFLEVRPSLGMVHSGYHVIDENGCILRSIEPWHTAPILDLETWFIQKPIRMGAMMYRRLWLESVGGLDPSIRQSQDVDLMLRLVLAGCTAEWMYKPTMCYRYYANSTIRRHALKQHGYGARVMTKFLSTPNLPDRIRQLGPRIRYYNLRYIAWHLYKFGRPAAVVSPLEQGFLYSPRPGDHTAVEIAERFVQNLTADGRSPHELETILPSIQQAGNIPDQNWLLIERFIRWWLEQWPASQQWLRQDIHRLWRFCHHLMQQEAETGIPMETIASWWVDVWTWYLFATRPPTAEPFQPFAQLSLETIIQMSQVCLVHNLAAADLEKINRFWTDLTAAGLVPKGQQQAVTALYLTWFGQKLVGRQWQAAWSALARAISGLFSAAGWRAWARFGRAITAYYPLGIQPQPHLLLGSVLAFPDDHLVTLVAGCRQAGWLVSAAATQKIAVHSLALSQNDWLPAEALTQLAKDRPANHGRYLRQMRAHNDRMAPYRRLPLLSRPWRAIYLSSLAEAAANRHIFDLGYPVILRVQGKDDGLLARDEVETILQQVTAIHCTTPSAQDWLLQQQVPASKLHLIPPGIDTDFFVPPANSIPHAPLRLIMAGVLDWGGGFEYGLLALKQLLVRGMAVTLDIVGDGPDYGRVLYTAYDLQIEAAVHIHKLADRETLRHLLHQAHIFLLPQVQDALPTPLLAAMACGRPIVTSDLPALRTALVPVDTGMGQSGCLVPPRQPECMEETVFNLAANSEQCQTLGTSARQRVLSAFSAHQQQAAFIKMLAAVR